MEHISLQLKQQQNQLVQRHRSLDTVSFQINLKRLTVNYFPSVKIAILDIQKLLLSNCNNVKPRSNTITGASTASGHEDS